MTFPFTPCRFLFSFALLAGAAACSSSSSAAAASPFQSVCLELNGRVGDRARGCGVDAWLDGSSSIQHYCAALEMLVEGGTVRYDDTSLSACRAAVEAASCCDLAYRTEQHGEGSVEIDVLRSAAPCHALLRGTKPEHASCQATAE